MKKLKYPTKLLIAIDKTRGRKLDNIAEADLCSRPSVLLKALDHFFQHRSRPVDHDPIQNIQS